MSDIAPIGSKWRHAGWPAELYTVLSRPSAQPGRAVLQVRDGGGSTRQSMYVDAAWFEDESVSAVVDAKDLGELARGAIAAATASAPLRPKPAPRPQPKTFRIGQRWLRKSDQLEGEVVGVRGYVIGVLRMQDRTLVPLDVPVGGFGYDFDPNGWTFIGGPTEHATPQEALAEAVETAKMLCPVGVRAQDWLVVLAGLQQHLAQGGMQLDADQYLWAAQLAGLVLVDYSRASRERDR